MEFFLEGMINIGVSRRVPKWIRYPVLVFILLIYVLLICGLLFLGVSVFKVNIFGGLFILLVVLCLFFMSLFVFKKKYDEMKK